MFKSIKDVFAAAERELIKLGYTVSGITSAYHPVHKNRDIRE